MTTKMAVIWGGDDYTYMKRGDMLDEKKLDSQTFEILC